MIFPKGNSSHHLERMGEFLQSIVKTAGIWDPETNGNESVAVMDNEKSMQMS